MLTCASASGKTKLPMVVFAGKHFNSAVAQGQIPATFV